MRKHLLVILLLTTLPTFAEHLFEAGLRAGLAAYDAQCTYVTAVPDLHAGLLLTYSYHSPYVIGFRIGAAADRHRAGFAKVGYTDSYTTIDVENAPMQVDYTIGYLHEHYTVWSVALPLQVAVSWRHLNLYLGPMPVLPLSAAWQETAEDAELSVYYPLQDNRVLESFPLAASRHFREQQDGTQPSRTIRWWLSAEVSYDILVHTARRSRSYISVGLYADYALTRTVCLPSDRPSLLMLSDTRDGFPLRRLMTTVVTARRAGQQLVTDYCPFDLGLKLAYRIAPYDPAKRNTDLCHCYGIF
ncbi:MAG: hypothetical protein IJ609_01470 [Paludibacteraceae bacterium]|nr:hypothetical protein [Paludibacteraceae bacterium]